MDVPNRVASLITEDPDIHDQERVFYKEMEYLGRRIRRIPGYAIMGDPTWMIAEAQEDGMKKPHYKFKVAGTYPFPFTDIVGIPRSIFSTTKEGEVNLPSQEEALAIFAKHGIKIGDTGIDAGFSRNGMDPELILALQAIKPGWHWNQGVKTGRTGESLITAEVEMVLLDGEELAAALQAAAESFDHPEAWMSHWVKNARKSGVPYRELPDVPDVPLPPREFIDFDF